MSSTTAPADADTLARWVLASSEEDDFWASTPRWRPEAAWRVVDGHVLVLVGATVLSVPPAPALVAQFLDGESTLAELAEDAAEASGASLEEVRAVVASMAVELHAWGALEGVAVAPVPEPAEADTVDRQEVEERPAVYTVVDAETGIELRVEEGVDADGHRVVTEYLPDGRRHRITTELTFHTGAEGAEAAEDLAAAVLDGRRSAAELVPLESCLGSKLRNEESVPLLSIRCPDGVVRSVRCHDPAVLAELTARAGDRVVTDGRGPVEAFVVTPLEGEGPLRIYDGRGKRRGRPRTVAEAADVVDQVLGEVAVRDNGSDILLDASLAVHGDLAVLLGEEVLDDHVLRRRLRDAGWVPAAARAVLRAGAHVGVPSALGPGVDLPPESVRLAHTHGPVPVSFLVPHLPAIVPDAVDPHDGLDRLVAAAGALVGAPFAGVEVPDLHHDQPH